MPTHWRNRPSGRSRVSVFSMWPVGDRYRMLLALARHDLGAERVAEILAPAREHGHGGPGREGSGTASSTPICRPPC